MFCVQVKHGNHYKTVSPTYFGRGQAEIFRGLYLKQFPEAEPARVLTVAVEEPQKVAADIKPGKTALRRATKEQERRVDELLAGGPKDSDLKMTNGQTMREFLLFQLAMGKTEDEALELVSQDIGHEEVDIVAHRTGLTLSQLLSLVFVDRKRPMLDQLKEMGAEKALVEIAATTRDRSTGQDRIYHTARALDIIYRALNPRGELCEQHQVFVQNYPADRTSALARLDEKRRRWLGELER